MMRSMLLGQQGADDYDDYADTALLLGNSKTLDDWDATKCRQAATNLIDQARLETTAGGIRIGVVSSKAIGNSRAVAAMTVPPNMGP